MLVVYGPFLHSSILPDGCNIKRFFLCLDNVSQKTNSRLHLMYLSFCFFQISWWCCGEERSHACTLCLTRSRTFELLSQDVKRLGQPSLRGKPSSSGLMLYPVVVEHNLSTAAFTKRCSFMHLLRACVARKPNHALRTGFCSALEVLFRLQYV
jgi:hypothetical protein